jgi:uncharacterized membrane protein YccC
MARIRQPRTRKELREAIERNRSLLQNYGEGTDTKRGLQEAIARYEQQLADMDNPQHRQLARAERLLALIELHTREGKYRSAAYEAGQLQAVLTELAESQPEASAEF